jgi:hypothetical protein
VKPYILIGCYQRFVERRRQSERLFRLGYGIAETGKCCNKENVRLYSGHVPIWLDRQLV